MVLMAFWPKHGLPLFNAAAEKLTLTQKLLACHTQKAHASFLPFSIAYALVT